MRSSYSWFYFFAMVLVFAAGLSNGVESPLEVVSAIVVAFVFVAGYGYLARIGIGRQSFWQVYFWVFVVNVVIGLTMGIVESFSGLTLVVLGLLGFVAILWLLLVFILWSYAFDASDIWSNTRTEA